MHISLRYARVVRPAYLDKHCRQRPWKEFANNGNCSSGCIEQQAARGLVPLTAEVSSEKDMVPLNEAVFLSVVPPSPPAPTVRYVRSTWGP